MFPITSAPDASVYHYLNRTWYKVIFALIKNIFIELWAGIVNGSNLCDVNSVLLSNQKYNIQPTLINLRPNEYSQEFHFYSFAVK